MSDDNTRYPWAGDVPALNAGIEFLAAHNDNERPCLQTGGGAQCCLYYDTGGTLCISIHLDGHDVPALPDGTIPIRVLLHDMALLELPEAELPPWDHMSDRDKGAALLHVQMREWEGDEYAVDNYPAQYRDDPRLVALSPMAASEHAETVTGGYETIFGHLGEAEYQRLHQLALTNETTN